jgi:hypothetical protein
VGVTFASDGGQPSIAYVEDAFRVS